MAQGENKDMQLSKDLFQYVRDYLYEESGLYYANYKKYLLEGRLLKRLSHLNMTSFNEYISYIRSSQSEDSELINIFKDIAKSESYFFQNTSQLKALTEWVIPELEEKKSEKHLRIGSFSADQGEEAYSLAIALHDFFGGHRKQWKIQIVGFFQESERLAMAEKGEYESYAIRNASRKHILRYFDKVGAGFQLNNEIRSLVSFQHCAGPEDLGYYGRFDVIFCRNRLMSLGYSLKQTLIRQLENALRLNGILFLGQMETLHNLEHDLELCHFPNTLAYVNKIQGES